MSDWTSAPLSGVADIRFSNVDKKTHAHEEPVSLCNYMDVYANDYVTADLNFMSASATRLEIDKFRIDAGDVIITKDSETPDDIGIATVVRDAVPGLVCGYHLALLKIGEEMDPVFLAKQLGSPEIANYFARRASGSTRYGLSARTIAETPISLAPPAEQRKIGQIFTTLDEAIAQTKALIAKRQMVKAGMMRDLFTRGVTPDGRLRPLEAGYQSRFGAIPKTWRTGTLLDFADPKRQAVLTGPFGADLGADDFVEDGVPLLRIGNVQQASLDLKALLYVSEAKAAALRKYVVRDGDLLFARQGATTGRNALATSDVDGALINYHIIRVALDPMICAPVFLQAAFDGEIVRRQIERDKGRGTREGINTKQLLSLEIPLPDVEEQRLVARVLSAHNAEIENLKCELGKFDEVKSGLMQDLLTGRVRVGGVAEGLE